MVTLGDICELKYGKSLSAASRENSGEYDVFGSNGVVGRHSAAITEGATIVVGRKGSLGELNYSESSCWPIDTTYYVDKTCTDVDLRWLFHAMASLRLTELNRAAAIPGLNRNDAYAKPILLPSQGEQRRIATILDKAEALRAKRREAIAKLEQLLQSVFLDMFGDPVTNPMGWNETQLGEVCDVGSSNRVFAEELVDTGVPFYRGTEIGQLGEGKPITPGLFITWEHYERLKGQSGVPEQGDLLLPSICHDGRIHLVTDDSPFYFKDGRVLWIKSGRSQLNSSYLRFHLKQLFFANYSKIASGTTFAELKIFALKAIKILMPPLQEQARFGEIVDSIYKLRACKLAHLDHLNSLFTSIQQRAFSGHAAPRVSPS
ncbi:restriction endonuclease subunit S [Cognatilysobacter lacus]|nr:restriction endonuclease subunit S [Lysobacter lacus]